MALSDEQAMILDSAKEFCRNKSDITDVRSLLKSATGFNSDVWQEMIELGWTGMTIPEQYGGSEMGIGSAIPLVENMGRYLLCTPFISSTISAETIIRGGSESQQSRWLPAVAQGSVGTMALLDNEDWGATDTDCILLQDQNDFILQGKKFLVADAEAADFFIVLAKQSDSLLLVIVEASQIPASAIEKKTLVDETKRAANVDFSGIKISRSAVLPEGAKILPDIRLIGALLIAAEATGCAAAALDTIVDYLTTRKQFGRLIGSYQSLKHPTVDVLIQMDSARSFIYHAATLIDQDALDRDTEIACRMSKAQAAEALSFAGDRAVQFHGGMGFTYECDAMLYIRRAQWAQHQYGDPQHHRKCLAGLLLD
jgi:alkylation response protein AidB-like acyl-CoA dehydrogenase